MHWLPRSTGHDIALAVILAALWGTWFCWQNLGRRFRREQRAIFLAHEALIGASVLGIFGMAYYLIFKG